MKVQFSAKEHKYTINGVPVISVTQLLAEEGIVDYSSIPVRILDAANKLGTAVHYATELDDKKKLDENSLDIDLYPYILAWRDFKSDFSIKAFRAIEKRLGSQIWGVGGTLDRVFKDIIIEIKSSTTVLPGTSLQTAGYQILWEENSTVKIKERWCIQLKSDGTYRQYKYKDKKDLSVFKSLIQVNSWKMRNLK